MEYFGRKIVEYWNTRNNPEILLKIYQNKIRELQIMIDESKKVSEMAEKQEKISELKAKINNESSKNNEKSTFLMSEELSEILKNEKALFQGRIKVEKYREENDMLHSHIIYLNTDVIDTILIEKCEAYFKQKLNKKDLFFRIATIENYHNHQIIGSDLCILVRICHNNKESE